MHSQPAGAVTSHPAGAWSRSCRRGRTGRRATTNQSLCRRRRARDRHRGAGRTGQRRGERCGDAPDPGSGRAGQGCRVTGRATAPVGRAARQQRLTTKHE